MPRLRLDADGKQLRHQVLGGRAQIVQYELKPGVWVYRQLIQGTKRYISRQLTASTQQAALREAEDLFLAFQQELDQSGQKALATYPISDLLKAWVKVKEERQATGQLSESAVRGATSHLLGAVRIYLLNHKRLTSIGEIKRDTFLDYANWRMTEGWKQITATGERKPPKESTVKRDLVHVKDWFQNFLIPRGYVESLPTIPKLVTRQDQLDANPPIPLDPDWRLIYQHLERWSKAGEEFGNPRVGYWRQLFRHFVLISYNAGTRPTELLGKIEKRRKYEMDGSITIKEVLLGGLRWDDVKVEMADHLTESGKTFEFPEATLHIRYTKTGVPRDVPCNTGNFFIRWRQFCDEYRRKHSLPALTQTDYVFFNPYTGKPYTYTQFHETWKQMRQELGSQLTPTRGEKDYTIYSLRSSYITNQIEEGKDIYLVKQLTGHSLEILIRHYDRSDVKKRRAEATARTYSRKRSQQREIDLNKLDSQNSSAAEITWTVQTLKKAKSQVSSNR